MKLEKAIEIIEIFRDEGDKDLPLDVEPAINLLIEAGKQLLILRDIGSLSSGQPLPGETEE